VNLSERAPSPPSPQTGQEPTSPLPTRRSRTCRSCLYLANLSKENVTRNVAAGMVIHHTGIAT
jgi:hypothetical protein